MFLKTWYLSIPIKIRFSCKNEAESINNIHLQQMECKSLKIEL